MKKTKRNSINTYIESKFVQKNTSPEDTSSNLIGLVEDENIQVFYPYNPEFEDDDKSINEYDVTYASEDVDETKHIVLLLMVKKLK